MSDPRGRPRRGKGVADKQLPVRFSDEELDDLKARAKGEDENSFSDFIRELLFPPPER